MGYYIQTANNKGKAKAIVAEFGGTIVPRLKAFTDVPTGKALVIVKDNGLFEAAAYIYNENEFNDFTDLDDPRPTDFVLMDEAKAKELSDFRK